MSKKMSKKKKVLIIILVVVAVYIATTIPYRIIKGNKVYGDELCAKKGKHNMPMPAIVSEWQCQICGWTGMSGGKHFEICDLCAFITNRCEECGGKLK